MWCFWKINVVLDILEIIQYLDPIFLEINRYLGISNLDLDAYENRWASAPVFLGITGAKNPIIYIRSKYRILFTYNQENCIFLEQLL